MGNETPRRNRLLHFFSKTSNAIIAAAATIIAALITVVGVSKHEERSQSLEIATLQPLVKSLTNEVERIRADADAKQRMIDKLREALEVERRRTTTENHSNPVPETTVSVEPTSNKPAKPPERPAVKPPMLGEVNGFTFALTQCTRSGETVLCHLTVTNNENQRTLCVFGGSGATRVVDDHANEYHAESVQLGSSHGRYTSVRVPSGVPLNCWLRFRNIPQDTRQFKLLQIYLADVCFNYDHMLEFRNVEIAA